MFIHMFIYKEIAIYDGNYSVSKNNNSAKQRKYSLKKHVGKAKWYQESVLILQWKNTPFGYCAYDELSKTLVTTCSQQENLIVEGKK